MNRIKVLKDIIHDHDPDYTAEASESDLDSFADEINQLYEPQTDDYCGICKREFLNGDTRYPLGGKYGSPLCPDCLNSQPISKPQPDQSSRLLDIDEYLEEMGWTLSKDGMAYAWLKQFRDRQRDLTASIKDVEWTRYYNKAMDDAARVVEENFIHHAELNDKWEKAYEKALDENDAGYKARIGALIKFIMIFLKDAGYGSKVADIGWMQFQDKYNIPAGELSLVEELEIALKANPTSEVEG